MKKIMVAIPSYGDISAEVMGNIMSMCFRAGLHHNAGNYEITGFWVMPRVMIAKARKLLVKRAIECEATHILFIDDDMVVPEILIERLLSHDKPLVAALAFLRLPPHHPVAFKRDKSTSAMNYAPILDYKDKKDKNGLLECDAVGFGTCLIDLSVFSNVIEPWFWFGDGYGEDIFFCSKLEEAGIPIYMDVECEVGHVSRPLVVREAQFEAVREAFPDDFGPGRCAYFGDKFHVREQDPCEADV